MKEKEKEYVEIENYMEMEKSQQGIGLKVLESIESQAPTIVKRKELSDISNLVQKSEIGPQMIFSTYSLEKAVKKDIERLKVTAREVQEIRKKESLVVECLKWEICLINRVVENSRIRCSLIEILEQNEIYDSLVFYTDGSLGFSENKAKMEMGCGLVQVTEEGHIIRQVACGTEKWFSSTRAELVAILVALLVTPNEKEVEIRTDSNAAIFAIKKGLAANKARQWLKSKNVGLVATIVETIRTKKLALHLTKVKGHSGDVFNDLADIKAKEGAASTELLTLTALNTREFKLRYKWENEVIEKPIRSFVKMVGKVINRVEWTFVHNSQNTTHQERKTLQYWPIFYKLLESGTKQRNHTYKTNSMQLFELKCVNNVLPVFEKLNRRKPEIYKTDKCIICKKKSENVEHLVSCEVSLNLLRDIEEQEVESTLKEVKKYKICMEKKKRSWS